MSSCPHGRWRMFSDDELAHLHVSLVARAIQVEQRQAPIAELALPLELEVHAERLRRVAGETSPS